MKSISVLKSGGIYVSVNVDFPFNEKVHEVFAKKNIKGAMVAGQTHEHLAEIAKLIDEGKVKIFVSKIYQLEQVAEAHKESAAWHVRGKLVLEVRK